MAWTFYTPDISPSIGTVLPSNPLDGQVFVLVDSLTAPTYSWQLRYVAAKASNKWIFIGGSPAYAEVTTSQSTNSTTYTDLATVGPSITLPVAGTYIFSNGFYGTPRENDANVDQFMSYQLGTTSASDSNACQMGTPTQTGGPFGHNNNTTRTKQISVGASELSVVSKYRVSGSASLSFANRWLMIVPVAIGG